MFTNPLNMATASIALMLLTVPLAAMLHRSQRLVVTLSFALTAIASLAGFTSGILAVTRGASFQRVIAMGLPGLPFHVRLDPLAGFFLAVIGCLSFFVSVYSIGYTKGFLGKRSVTGLAIFYSIFLAGMFMVVLSDDALIFLISWEIMAAASYFLVMFEHERAENRRAALLYIIIAHVGAIAILLSFGVLSGLATGVGSFQGYTFDAMRQAQHPLIWTSVAFLLALIGFGAKAGIVPLHVWLPEAHPVAPSNVSALMSGAMLKTAVYGIVRIVFDLTGEFPVWWGAVVLTIGLVSALIGVLFALMQTDLKKLLAYCSVENIGVIFIGLGLSMIFHSFGFPVLAALALIAALYHTMNHAIYKGLLFMAAGAVLHSTGERNMEDMGGLIRLMPITALLFLVGCVSISALPPFNGFVSEWLLFQALLQSPALPTPLIRLLIPLGAAMLALTGAIAAATFVKAFGVVFLGHWRGARKPNVHEANMPMLVGMGLSALACLALGVLPTTIIKWIDIIPQYLLGATLSDSAASHGWMWLTPIASERASYSGVIASIVIIAVVVATYIILHVKPGRLSRGPIWDCGFEKLTPRMQYNSTSFSMPLRTIFGFLFWIKESHRLLKQSAHPAFPVRMHYRLKVRDRIWGGLYKPIISSSFWVSRQLGRLQQGRINTYLIYSFLTIIVLLVFM